MNIIKRIIGIFRKPEVVVEVEVEKKKPLRYMKVYETHTYEEMKELLEREVKGLGVFFYTSPWRIDPFGGESIETFDELDYHESRKQQRSVAYVRYLGYFAEDNLPEIGNYIYQY